MQWFSPDNWSQLTTGAMTTLPGANVAEQATVFPGAFNPLHDGHREMARLAGEWGGESVWYELSIENVDKPQLEFDEVARRLSQFVDQNIVLTSAATFAEKAALFPGSTFVVGIDTLIRIGDARYYDGSTQAMQRAIDAIADYSCRFLVFGRTLDGAFRVQHDIAVADRLAALCQSVSESEFRSDVSSTELRMNAASDSSEL
ncbi:MAG: hypothetical protein MI757_06280 [Pirellulales bacterium]|nr:hypothetical protein [Pirellulales bacterium]